jgi:hypothetical protein
LAAFFSYVFRQAFARSALSLKSPRDLKSSAVSAGLSYAAASCAAQAAVQSTPPSPHCTSVFNVQVASPILKLF